MTEENRVKSNSLVFAGPYFGDLETEVTKWVPYIRWLQSQYNGKHLAVGGYPGFHALYRGIANEYWNVPDWFVAEMNVPNGFDAGVSPESYLKLIEHFRTMYDGKFADRIEVRPPRGATGTILKNQMLFEKLTPSPDADTHCRELLHYKSDKPCVVILAETGKHKWPESNWNQFLGMLHAKYGDVAAFAVGGGNIQVPEYAINLDTFDPLARTDMTIAFLSRAMCSFSTQGGLTALSLHTGCPSFIYGHQETRWCIDENPLNTEVFFFETTDGGYSDNPDGEIFQDACATIENILDRPDHTIDRADRTMTDVNLKTDPEQAPLDRIQGPAGETDKENIAIGMVGVFDVDGSTNIPFANAFEKAGRTVRRINYRTEFKTVGAITTCQRIVELSKRVDLLIFCKGNGIPPDTVKECSKHTTTCWYMMDAWIHLEGAPDYIEFANACDFTVVTSMAMKEALEAADVWRPIHHVLQGVDPEEFHPVVYGTKKYDVGFIGQATEKRTAILQAIDNADFSTRVLGPGYSGTGRTTTEEFNQLCADSRVMIAISNTDPAYDSFSDRVSRYLAAGSCVLSEGSLNIDKYYPDLPLFTSPEHAVEAVKTLIVDYTAKNRAELASAGRKRVLDNYTWDHVAEEVVDIRTSELIMRSDFSNCDRPIGMVDGKKLYAAHDPACHCDNCNHDCKFNSESIANESDNESVANETDFATKPRLNIGFLTQWFERGQAYVTQQLRNTLVADHDVYVMGRNTTNDPEQLNFSDADEFKVPNIAYSGTYMINPEGFRLWIEKNKIDVVFFNEEPQIELVQIARQCGARTVGYFVWELFDPRNADATRDNYDVVIAPTEAAFKHFQDMGIANTVHVRWGIDTNFDDVKGFHDMDDSDTLFFHPAGWGGLHDRRATPAVIDAFLKADMPNAKLLVHSQQGQGDEHHGNITIRRGTVPRDEIIRMYHEADVVVLPSKWEGLGLTFLEAIAARKPIITVDAPPMNEFVNGRTGMLCLTKNIKRYEGMFVDGYDVDVEDLAASMKCLAQPDARVGMDEHIDAMAKRHSFDQFSDQIVNLVAKLHGNSTVQQPVKQLKIVEIVDDTPEPVLPSIVKSPAVPAKPVPPAITTVEKTRIFWTSQHCCIRVIKLALALMKTGRYEIHHAAAQPSWGAWLFDKFSMYHDKKQLENLLRDCPADIYIHSNEPNWQLNRIRKMQPDARIILDAHDMDSIRQGLIPLDEHRAMTNCDAVLFPSTQCRDFVMDLHKDQAGNKPSAVIEHYCSDDFVNETEYDLPVDQRSGLVYQGGAQPPPYNDPRFRYRQLYHIFRQIVEQGNDVHLIFGNPDATHGYNNIGAFVHPAMEYDKLMRELRKHKWGMVVFNNGDRSQHQVNWTRTNKEQEYLTTGMPLIVFGADATAEYVRENEIGLVFERIEDIKPEILDREYARVKANVDKLRPTLTMESHIHRLDEMIQNLLQPASQ